VAILYQHEYGLRLISQYENLMLVSSSSTFFWVAAIGNTLIPYYNNADENDKGKVLFNTFILLLVFSLIAAVVIIIIGYVSGKNQNLFQMFSIVVLLNTPTYIVDYLFYLKGKYKSLIIWGIVTFLAQILLLCLPLYYKQSLNLAINLLLVLALIKFNYTIILLMKYGTITVQKKITFDFMKKATPVMFSILLAGSMEYINSYIVEFKFSDEEFAMYRYGARELPIFLILANTLSSVYSGEIAKLNTAGSLEVGLNNLKNSSRKLMRWLFPSTILLMFLSPYMFKYAYNTELTEGHKIFNIYLLLIISRMVYPQTVIMGIMKSRIFYLISSNYLIIYCVLSFWFLSLFGLNGIAYATVVAYIVEKIMLAIYCKMQGINYNQYTPVLEHAVYSVITLVAYYFSTIVEMPFL
jgi:O-antigen/teichoic acid export membrane protein